MRGRNLFNKKYFDALLAACSCDKPKPYLSYGICHRGVIKKGYLALVSRSNAIEDIEHGMRVVIIPNRQK